MEPGIKFILLLSELNQIIDDCIRKGVLYPCPKAIMPVMIAKALMVVTTLL